MPGKDDSVREALKTKGAYGKDIDLDAYEEGDRDADSVRDLEDSEYRRYMENVGVVADEMERSGTLMFIDNGMSHCSPKTQEGLEM
ncbi:MAG: SufD family Fe-S cluster assembly protein, partial [Candidatus Methanomethylophilaceae archaeon]|nr:SufD family Fe-S cluster assembly protein [Candidatus Methanomethylophilaceae archaeon]